MRRPATEEDMKVRRRLIEALTEKGFKRWDMDRDGAERFKRGDEVRTVRFDKFRDTYILQ